MKKIIPLLLVFIFAAACDRELSSPNTIKGVNVAVDKNGLTVINGTEDELRFFLVNQASLAALNWAPYCLDSGLILQPGDKESIPYGDIFGYTPGCKVVVHWWPCHEVDGRRQPGEVLSLVVQTTTE